MIKTLAMLKMEKNFVAVIEKKYPRKPYEVYSTRALLARLRDEYMEAVKSLEDKDIDALKLELADISNIVDYMFERITGRKIT